MTRTILGAQIVCEASRNGITANNGYLWIITRVVEWRTYFTANQTNTGGYTGCTQEYLNSGLAGSFVVEANRSEDIIRPLISGYQTIVDYQTDLVAFKEQNYPDDPTTYEQRGKFVDEAFDAVFAAALALDAVSRLRTFTDLNIPFDHAPATDSVANALLLHNLIRSQLIGTSFNGIVGHVGFDANYDPVAKMNVYQLQSKGIDSATLVFRTAFSSQTLRRVNSFNW